MIRSAQNLKVRGVVCALRFVRVVHFSMSHGGRDECNYGCAWIAVVSDDTVNGVCSSVDLTSPSIKRNLSIF